MSKWPAFHPVRLGAALLAGGICSVVVAMYCSVNHGTRLGVDYSFRELAYTSELVTWWKEHLPFNTEVTPVASPEVRVRTAVFSAEIAFDSFIGPPQRASAFRAAGLDGIILEVTTGKGSGKYVEALSVRAGWPLRCLHGERWRRGSEEHYSGAWETDSRSFPASDELAFLTGGRITPFAPLWPGLLVNSALYGSGFWGLSMAPAAVRRNRRRRRHRCLHCNYDLLATPDHCPECGWQRIRKVHS